MPSLCLPSAYPRLAAVAGKSDKLRGASKIYVSQAPLLYLLWPTYYGTSAMAPPSGHLPTASDPRTCCQPTVYHAVHSRRRRVSQARYLNTQALLRKYAPLAVVLLLVLGMLWWRFR